MKNSTINHSTLKRLICLITLVTLLMILFSPFANATIYYVRTDGSDLNAGTGPASGQAWATIVYAATQVTAGDIVYVAPGTYGEEAVIANSGTSGNLIQFIADTDGSEFSDIGAGDVKIDDGYEDTNEGFELNGKDYIVIDGFKIVACDSYGIYLYNGADNNTIKNCTIYNITGLSDIGIYMRDAGTSYNTIENCVIHTNTNNIEIALSASDITIQQCAIYSSSNEGIKLDNADNCIIDDCDIYSNADPGVYVYNGSGNTIIKNCDLYSNDDYGIEISIAGSIAKIYNNIIRDNTKDGIYISADGSKIYNNTIYENTDAGIYLSTTSIAATIKNNIITKSGAYGIENDNTAAQTITNNNIFNNTTANYENVDLTGTDGNISDDSPSNFVDEVGDDYHLNSDAPSKDAGTDLSGEGFSTDMDGNDRTGTWDIGAYEYGAGACTPPTTQATNFGTSSIAITTMTISWTRGNGDNILVIAKAGSAPTDPANGTSYTANASYSTGDAVGGGFAIYNGTGTSVNLTNLTANTTYYFGIYEYYNTDVCYNKTELTGNETTMKNAPATQAHTITFSEVSCPSMTVSWIRGNGDYILVLAHEGSAVDANPSDGSDYTANSVFGSGDQIGTGNYVVYEGTGTSVNVSGLTINTTYHFRLYEFNNTGSNTKYNTNTATDNPNSQSTLTMCTATWEGDEQYGFSPFPYKWNEPLNWDIGIVPTSVYDVVIPAVPAGPGMPTMYYAGGVCKNLTNNGIINGDNAAQLDIYGNYSGSGTFENESITVYYKGSADVTISGSPTFSEYFFIEKANSSVKVTLASNISANICGINEGILDMGAGYDASFPSITIYDGGKLYIHNSGSTFETTSGHFNINQGGTLDIDDGQINIFALFLVDGALDMSGGTITQNGWTVNQSAWTTNSTINITAGTIDFQTCANFYVYPASSNISGGTIKVAKNMTVSNNFTPTGGVVEFYSDVANSFIVCDDEEESWFYRLRINKSGGKYAHYQGDGTGYDAMVIKENLYIDAGGLVANDISCEIVLYGDWYNNSGSDLYTENGTVTFKGSANSTIYGPTGGETFDDLTIFKNSSNQTVSFTGYNEDIIVDGILTLKVGKIVTGSKKVYITDYDEEYIEDGSGGSTHDYSDSWINGNLTRNVASTGTYDLPVGTSANCEAAIIKVNSSTGIGELNAKFTNPHTTSIDISSLGLSISGTDVTTLLDYGFWTMTTDATAINYDVTLTSRGHTNGGTNAAQHTIVKRPNGSSDWEVYESCHDNATQSGTGSSPITAKLTGMTNFSDFAIARSTSGILPIELLFFTAVCKDDEVQLNWATASETNNDFFTLEKCRDDACLVSDNWELVTNVNGAGNASTIQHYEFIDKVLSANWRKDLGGASLYYRLKQTDYNGAYEYFDMVAVNCKEIADNNLEFIYVAQNQNRDGITVLFNSNEDKAFGLFLFDILGHKVISQKGKSGYGLNLVNINTGNLPCGIYLIVLQNEDKTVTKKIMVN